MKLSYDKETDSLYIHLSTPSVDSDEVADGVVLDFDSNGTLVGIDVQHASEKTDIQSLPMTSNKAKKPPQNPYSKQWEIIRNLLNLHNLKQSEELLFERIGLSFLCVVLLFTPGMLIRWLGGCIGHKERKLGIELYVLGKTVFCLFALFYGLWSSYWYLYVSVYLLIDLFTNLIALVLLRNFWQTPFSFNRTLICLGFNFVEYTGWFSGLYLHFDSLYSGIIAVKDPLSAYYFSIVTAVTVGYGDIVPTVHGRNIVIAEILCSLLFLTFVVTYIMGNLNLPKNNR